MKRRIFISLGIIAVVSIAIGLGFKPLVKALITRQLAKQFSRAKVKLLDTQTDLTTTVALRDLSIRRSDLDIQLSEIDVNYDWSGLAQRNIDRVRLKGVVAVTSPSQRLADWIASNFSLSSKGGKALSVEHLQLDPLVPQIRTRDFKLDGVISAQIDPKQKTIRNGHFEIEMLEFQKAKLKNVVIELDDQGAGTVTAEQLIYNKLKLTGINGHIQVSEKEIRLSDLVSQTLNGKIEGNIVFHIAPSQDYEVHLQVSALSVEQFVKDFELDKKFNMTGFLNGQIALSGQGTNFKILSGHLTLDDPGGDLTIQDVRFLQNMALMIKQPEEMVVDSFKNYNYNTGVVKLSLEEGSVVVRIALEGQAGKRDLAIYVHDLF